MSHCDTVLVLAEQSAVLLGALDTWATRDDSIPQAGVRRSGNTAVESIDRLTRELHELRGRLLTEMRRSDDASAERVDALLARRGPVQG
ncbi:MAG: hypothetical protein ABIQ18_35420 [Umezawaea sp.]